MHLFWLSTFLLLSYISIQIYLRNYLIEDLADLQNVSCPNLNKLTINVDGFRNFITNVINTKKVYRGKFEDQNVYIKHLPYNTELNDHIKCTLSKCASGHREPIVFDEFHICSSSTSEKFFNRLNGLRVINPKELTALINPEPLLLSLQDRTSYPWHTPELLKVCGRLIVESDAGESLATLALKASFFWRVRIAEELLRAAMHLTDVENERDFRLYLTDVSYDNVVFTKGFTTVLFVDLDSVILNDKSRTNGSMHLSRYFDDEASLIYSVDDICQSSVSDHNIYAICKVFLASNNGPSPLNEGLLYSPPEDYNRFLIDYKKNVNDCVTGRNGDRFIAAKSLLNIFKNIRKHY